MRVLVQRVRSAAVDIDGETVGRIAAGLLIFVGVTEGDTAADARFLADKCVQLRIFKDEAGKMNLSLADTGGAALIVSQFTLYGDARKGRRPSFTAAAGPETAIPLYEAFVAAVKASGVGVATGQFGAEMQVSLCNDGPVTLIIESEKRAS
jgi:D-tyrosyl-tRNA(Tyr) deacylase